MEKAILIDGNNLMFRSYYATAYNGNTMKNSKGFSTNALYGFINMINKILNEEKPKYILVAFDKKTNFRKNLYKDYKAGRKETPFELLEQFPICKKILDCMGIKHFEIDDYEADDIIGTFAKMADNDKLYDATIISSDKDLLQLISNDVEVKLLKQSGFLRMDEKLFYETYGIEPIKMIDLKALMGDPSDNIPGVMGVGEKTALKLLQEFGNLENIYKNIDKIKGKLKEKLINDKDIAFLSKKLATIIKDVPFELNFKDLKLKERNHEKLNAIYEELEFYSLIKKEQKGNQNKIKTIIVKDIKEIENLSDYSIYIESDNINYHQGNIIGVSLYDGENSYYIDKNLLNDKVDFSKARTTFGLKKDIILLNKYDIKLENISFDTLIASYLLNYNNKDDIAYLANKENYNILFYENIINKKKTLEKEFLINSLSLKAVFIYETREKYEKLLIKENLVDLFQKIEMPLINVLVSMEMAGIKINLEENKKNNEEISEKIKIISNKIYDMVGEEFNISSPKQLKEILFNKLNISYPGKKKGTFSTNHEILTKLTDSHPVINLILEYRNLEKIRNTYLDSFPTYVLEDGKLHPIFNQTIARTGRLSCSDPNLQNIPVRTEIGKNIRKCFIPSNNKDSILTSDYSQIELRILAHITNDENLIQSFNKDEDIHKRVASDIFNVSLENVDNNMRRTAKAVIFGIVYGISGYGLGENLSIDYKSATEYIDKYLLIYPKVKEYMDNIIIEAKNNGEVRTLFNRKRVIDEINNSNYMIRKQGERIALNTPIQGTSADIIKIAMINIHNRFKKEELDSKMIIQIHDELVFDVAEKELNKVKMIVKEEMENVVKLNVKLKVKIDNGCNWFYAN